MAGEPLTQSFLVLAAATGIVGLVNVLHLPGLIGYIAAGILIGPHGLRLLAADGQILFLAELGIVLLMLMTGLEVSFSAAKDALRDVLGGGGLQVSITTFIVAASGMAFGMSWQGALILAGAVAMSSTALCAKQLADQGDLTSPHGRLAISILLFQDLAAIAFLVLLGSAGQSAGDQGREIVRGVAVTAIFLACVSFIGRPAFRIALARISRVRSEELFLLSVLLIAIGTAAAARLASLSAPIGAFLAGMAIGESDFRHQVEAELRSLRDVLLGLFFMTIGMQVNPSVLIEQPLAVLGWLLLFTLGKAAVIMLVGSMMGWPREISLRVAMVLAHGGEFGLLLLGTATLSGLIDEHIGQPALLALIITMALAPVLIRNKTRLIQMLPSWMLLPGEATRVERPPTLKDHVVICGYGRVGRLVVLAAEAAKLPYLCIENNGRRFAEAREAGYRLLFGDASRPEILRAATIKRAMLVVVTFDRRPGVFRLLRSIREQNPAAAILVSADDSRATEELAKTGATAVFPENLAAGLALADQTLLLAGFTQDEAADIIRRLRAEVNPKLEAVVGI